MKQLFTKLICYILVISIVLPTFVVSAPKVHAEETSTSEALYEGEQDSKSTTYKAGDWAQARKDGCYWNFFHNEVQTYITDYFNNVSKKEYNDSNSNITVESMTAELKIHYNDYVTNPVTKKSTKTGSVDLSVKVTKEDKEITYLWEVKPYSYFAGTKRTNAQQQLANYLNSELRIDSEKNNDYRNGGLTSYISSGVIPYVTAPKNDAKYKISYDVCSDGLILYKFEKIEDNNDDLNGEPVTETEEETDEEPATENLYDTPGVGLDDDLDLDEDNLVLEDTIGEDEDEDILDLPDNFDFPPIPPPPPHDENGNYEYRIGLTPASEAITYYWFGKIKDIPDSYSYSPTEQPPLTFDSYGNVVSGDRIIITASVIVGLCLSAEAAIIIHSKTTDKTSHSSTIVKACKDFLNAVREAKLANDPKQLIIAYNNFMSYASAFGISNKDILNMTTEELQEKINKILEKIQGNSDEYSEAETSLPPSDPLIIDFGRDGIELHSIENGVNFDLDNNGFAEKTAWIGTEDGFLALDRNNNKKFDNGSELFGDKVTLKSGLTATSGFEALAELDTNGDKTIDVFDSDFSKLYVWFDKNHNGVSEAGEFKTLSEVNVKSISLLTETSNIIDDETGMRIAESADVTITEAGKTKTTKISEFWFPVDLSDTTRNGETTTGNVPSLYEALENDNTGLLTDLWNEFCNSSDYIQKRYLSKQILYTITNSNDIAKNSRGGNIDARDLHVIEQFMGRKFVGIGGTDPNTNAAVILENIIIDIEEKYYTTLNLYSSLGGYLSGVFEYEDENGNKYLNLALLYDFINSNENEGKNMDCLIYDLSIYLKTFDEINNTNYSKSNFEYFNSKDNRYSFIFNYTELSDSYIGTSLDEIYNGSNGNDLIFTENGNDILYGRNGNDYLDGGYGNDILQGGEGNDTYVYGKGYGNDTIFDNAGYDKIKFVGFSPSDFTVYYPANTHEAILTVNETGETLTIQYFRSHNLRETLVLEFEDGNIMKLDDLNSPFLNIIGREDTKSLIIFYGNSIAKVIGSACTVNGSAGNDTIYGGDNNDILYGRNGNDYLEGGYGDDILQGGEGNDIYVYGKGYGNDTIFDNTGYDKIKFVGLSPSDFTVYYPSSNHEAILTVTETGETLTIQYFRSHNLRETLVLEFEDGNIMKLDDLNSPFLNIIGRKDTKSLIIFYENSIAKVIGSACTVNGSAGNDTIYGGNNNDILYGRNGNDYLDGGYGDDILQGGEGDDTYVYGKNCGDDTISDNLGSNKIRIIGLSASDFTVHYPSSNHNAILTIIETDETLIIQNFRYSDAWKNFILEFEDGSTIKIEDLAVI